MATPRRRRPQVEPLEAKQLLSSTPWYYLGPIGALVRKETTKHPPWLNGKLSGTYQSTITNPDAGAGYTLSGHGHLGTLGEVEFNGTMHGTGFIATGRPGGTITLSAARGMVTLKLIGRQQRGFRPPSETNYRYVFQGGTGIYRNLDAAGLIILDRSPTAIATQPGAVSQGDITLRLHSDPRRV